MISKNKNVSIVGDMCTACSACIFSCPTEAISLTVNDMSTRVVAVDENKCINCAKCERVCPQLNETAKNSSSKVYAAWSKNDKYKSISSSGAIAPVFYEEIIASGGVVFGAVWKNGRVQIESTSVIEGVRDFCGSKYVESDISQTFINIETAIKENREILFVGLPCQVAAVKRIFKSDKLYTIDLICHGTPPSEYLFKYLESLGVEKNKNISFRGKDDFVLNVYNNAGEIVYSKGQYVDPYFKAFLDATIYKNCCYSCKYANPKRVSDITIGDFWGINEDTLINKPDGKISLLMVNTERGAELFDRVNDGIVGELRSLEEAVRYNRQLSCPSERNKERMKFEKNYKKGGFLFALNKMKSTKEIKNRNKFFTKVKNKVKAILGG